MVLVTRIILMAALFLEKNDKWHLKRIWKAQKRKKEGVRNRERARIKSEWVGRPSGKYIERQRRKWEVRRVEEEMRRKEKSAEYSWFVELRSITHSVVY